VFRGLLALALVGMLAPASTMRAADGLRLTATVGLDGIGRPGRWMPVRVTIDNQANDIDGELVVQWGHASTTHAIALPAPARRQFDLYVRTDDVRDEVVMRLRANGHDLARVDAPVRVVGVEAVVTACIGRPRPAAAPATACDATLDTDSLPRSWRGYDAADRVDLGADAAAAAPDQRRALALWRAIRRADDEGGVTPAAGLPSPAATPASHVRGTLTVYVVVLIRAGFFCHTRRSRVRWLAPVFAAIIVTGSAAADAIGRHSPVVVHHATVTEQFEGVPDALVSVRAIAEYPADGEFAVRVSSADAAIDAAAPDEAGDQRVDVNGHPVLLRSAGLGTTTGFTVEASNAFQPFEIARVAQAAVVTNASTSTLTGCEFPAGFAVPANGALAPGQSIRAEQVQPDSVIVCRFQGTALQFAEPSHAVAADGATTVVYHLAGPGTE
jgi:hypothetical protein